MLLTKKLKIWSIIWHAVIVIGAGHGIAPMALFALAPMGIFFEYPVSFRLNATFENHIPILGCIILFGYVMAIFSFAATSVKTGQKLFLIGLTFLWIGLILFIFETARNKEIVIPLFTIIPFLFCTIKLLVGKYIIWAYQRILKV